MLKPAVKQNLIVLAIGALLIGGPLAVCAQTGQEVEPRGYAEGGYSGEELFLGIMLGHGKVAEQIPELWEEPTDPFWDKAVEQVDPKVAMKALDREIAHARETGDRDEILVLEGVRARVKEHGLKREPYETPFGFEMLLERLRKQDKEFFERFAQEMQSGDHLRIQGALRDARALLVEVWLADGAQIFADPAVHPSNFWIRWTTIYKKRAIYKRTAVWKNRWIFGWFATANTLDDALAEEIVVNAIATRFARE